MLPRADIITVNPVGPATALTSLETVGDARQQAFQRSLAGLLGTSMQGQVLSRLTDGSFIVKVNGAPARMLLPSDVQVGSEVQLTLVSNSPRPTFDLATSKGFQPVHLLPDAVAPPSVAPMSSTQAAPLLSKAPLAPTEQLPAFDADSTPASLSAAARIITNVLSAALKADNPANAIIARTPLLAAPTSDPLQMAAALKDAIGKSGLFYESHLGEWSIGKRTLAELADEPQMLRAPSSPRPEGGARQLSPAADPATAQFINVQLASQEQGKVAWQGQLWPGQPMQWEIHKDAPDGRSDAGAESEPGWRSGLKFRFPLLGDIAANITLSGERLQIQLQADSGAIAALLRSHTGALSSSLEATGTTLSSLTITTPRTGDDD